jgi:hypothetical protein
MSSAEGELSRADALPAQVSATGVSTIAKPPPRWELWQSMKRGMVNLQEEASHFKNITFAGFIATCIVGYFQNLSAYQDKVTALAKTDMDTAAVTFTEVSITKRFWKTYTKATTRT